MDAKTITTVLMKETGTTQARLSMLLGMNTQQAISMALSRSDLRVGFFVRALDAMGYEVIVKKRTRGRKEEGVITVTAPESKEKKTGDV